MEIILDAEFAPPAGLPVATAAPSSAASDHESDAFVDLKEGVHAALMTYANVHRGSGHNSMASTHLYEQARTIVLTHLGLQPDRYVVVFCSPRQAELRKAKLKPGAYYEVSSAAIGLPLGVRALAIERRALPKGVPFQTGGGTARLVSPGWVIWAKAPDKLEAGTPAIINVIALAKALQLTHVFGADAFLRMSTASATADAASDATAVTLLYDDELTQASGEPLLNELRKTLIGRGVFVPTAAGARPFTNLDNAASTPTFTPIWDVVWHAWGQSRAGQQALVQETKTICAGMLGAPLDSYDVIFTSNTTEAINLVAESLAKEPSQGIEPVVLNTLLEHNSNELPWRMIPGSTLLRLTVDADGFVDTAQLESLLCAYNQAGQHGKQRIMLVAVSGASNVLGTYNDLAAISRIVHQYGARLLVDAAQMVAHRTITMADWGIDYLAFSGHKVYAPFGSGALVARKGQLAFSPEEMELICASGEENVGGIAALGKALVLLQRIGMDVIQAHEQALTRRLLLGLAQIPGLAIYGIADPDAPKFAHKGGVVAFNFKDMLPSKLAKELAEQGGIGVRSGCHCAHMLIKHMLSIPPLLQQFQGAILLLFPKLALPGVVRVSLGLENDAVDVDTLLDVLNRIAQAADGPRAGAPPATIQPQMDAFTNAVAARVYSTSA